MRKKISLSKFARKIGVSRTAVAKAVREGRIPRSLVGETELSTGRKVPAILDALAAYSAFKNEGGLDLTVIKVDPPASRAPAGIPASISGRVWDEVADLIHEEYEFARKALLALPGEIAASVAASTDAEQVRAIIEDAIRNALDDLTSDVDQYYAADISDIEPETSEGFPS